MARITYGSFDPEDERLAPLISLHDEWAEAYETGDTQAMKHLYSSVSAVMPRRMRIYRGWTEIQQFLNQSFSRGAISIRAHLQLCQRFDGIGVMRGLVWISVSKTGTDEVIEERARYLLTVMQDDQARWAIHQDMDQPTILHPDEEYLEAGMQ